MVVLQVLGGAVFVENDRHSGVVKWFSAVKGYGFIQPDQEGLFHKDIFVHFSAIQDEGFRTLEEGQPVEFSVEDSPKGPQAVNVVKTGRPKKVAKETSLES